MLTYALTGMKEWFNIIWDTQRGNGSKALHYPEKKKTRQVLFISIGSEGVLTENNFKTK